MPRNIIYAMIGSLLLHAAFAATGLFLRHGEEAVVAKDETPTIELAPMPPIEPDKPETTETNDDTPPPETDIPPPPMLTDTPSVNMDSPFEQQIQPPPANVGRPTGTINIPTGAARSAADKSKNIFDIASLDQKPVLTFKTNPTHPFELRRAHISGSATVRFIVDSSGTTRDAEVIDATHREFGPEAVKAVLKWKFRPGKKSGSAVNTRMEVTINFNAGAS